VLGEVRVLGEARDHHGAKLIPTLCTSRAEAAGQQREVVGEQLAGAQVAQALGPVQTPRNATAQWLAAPVAINAAQALSKTGLETYVSSPSTVAR
jgi:hypothetical protein